MDVILLALAVAASRKQALELAKEAIARAMKTSKMPQKGLLELDNALSSLLVASELDEESEDAFNELLDTLRESAQYDFISNQETPINIIEPEE
jgi:hypothetical protein